MQLQPNVSLKGRVIRWYTYFHNESDLCVSGLRKARQ